jgi:hypothetical protein
MRVDVEGLDQVMRSGVRAEAVLVGGVAREIQKAVQAAVDGERSSHRYTNRTGKAEASTRARATVDGATAEMGVQYAQVLNARGWSEFDIWMERADYEARLAFADLNSRL